MGTWRLGNEDHQKKKRKDNCGIEEAPELAEQASAAPRAVPFWFRV